MEGSFCNAFLVEEVSSFCSHYFEPHVNMHHRKVPHNNDCEADKEHEGNLSIFSYSGRSLGREKSRYVMQRKHIFY